MEMVAAAKVNKVFRIWKGFTPYLTSLRGMIDECVTADPDLEHPLVEKKKTREEKALFLVITSDMGLCGSYNLDILRLAEEREEAAKAAFRGYFVIGTKGISYLRYRNKKVYGSVDRFFGTPDFSIADMLSGRILSLLESGEVNTVKVISSRFKSSLLQKPTVIDLLPIKPKPVEKRHVNREYEYEPELNVLLNSLIPLYLSSVLLHILLEAQVSELYSRQNAMRSATENADNLIKRFTLAFNKARQGFITQEIIEIVNSAEALKE